MNLVTAVICENALENAAKDKEVEAAYQEEQKKQMVADLKDMFEMLDASVVICMCIFQLLFFASSLMSNAHLD